MSVSRLTAYAVCLLLVAASTSAIHAQAVRFETMERRDDGIDVEITAEWRFPIRTIVDSTGISQLDADAAVALVQGVVEAWETYELPALAEPRVTLLGSEYDELRLPPAADTTGWHGVLGSDVVYVTGLGVTRMEPVASLVVRLISYDAGTQSVRRYRRIHVRLQYGAETGGLNARLEVGGRLAGANRLLDLARPQSPTRLDGDDGVNARAGYHATTALQQTSSNPHLDVSRSALSDGIVFKIPITSEGIYRIDRQFLANLTGVSPDAIDPNHVRIYGNGGRPVPALNSAPRPADLIENPVYRVGGGDGRFDASDYVLFYGAAPSGWRYDVQRDEWEHYVHPFSNENFYFLKIGDVTDGLTVGPGDVPDGAVTETVSQVRGRFFRDFDEFMWSKENGTGHTWVSRTIRPGTVRDLIQNVSLPGFSGGDVTFRARVAIRSNPLATLFFESGGTLLGQQRAQRTITPGETQPVAAPSVAQFTRTFSSGGPISLSMRFDAQAAGAPEGAIDWLHLFYPQDLTARGDSLRFTTPPGRTGHFEFVLRGFSSEPHVWDVTDHASIRRLGVRSDGGTFRVRVVSNDPAQPRELIAFTPSIARTPPPASARRIAPQNLHGIAAYPDFVIVAPDEFMGPAEELAEYRRREGLDVVVADVEQIYNEFSGGLQDFRAIRDYFKFLYDRAPTDERRLRYALLFGDGHFNYRNLGDEFQRPLLRNWVPPYQTEESFDPITSYTSDDYFGLLDDEEGAWLWPGSSQARGWERVDLGVGRLPVQTVEEAAAMVAKIKHYESPATHGPWRTRYLFVADDGYNGIRPVLEQLPDLHTQNADVVADLVEREYPLLNVRKIYGISYTREFRGIWRLPGVERDLQAALNDGVLVMNYSGHGGEHGLAQEEIFMARHAQALENFDRMTIFVTATCSFGWWDLAREQSAAEILLLNPNGGAIALLTTVRLVFTSSSLSILNVGLNRALNVEMFRPDADGLPPRLGDVLRQTKNTPPGLEGNNRKFNLLGDPTLRVGVPSREAAIETINETPVAEKPQVRALDRITVTGAVRDLSGEVDGRFDGQVSLTVLDAERRVQLPMRAVMPQNYYTVREDLIWRGSVPVSSGRFEATFVVPKDISYSNEPGRMSVYAHGPGEHAGGFTHSFTVGGTSDDPPVDEEGPEIALFLNDTTFVSGGLTPPTPMLIVRLFDESGINAVGAGVGHEMLLVVNDDEQHAIDLSARFESDPNSYQSGRVSFSFDEYPVELEDGPHTLSVRAWDVLNNSNTETLDFFISSTRDLVLRNVYNYPNPTSGRTRFVFEHNQPPGTPADVQVRIYTLSGRPIRTLDALEALPSGVLTGGPVQVLWDGRDEDLHPLASGIYLYKVRVAVEDFDGERRVAERIERLAVIR